jgi:hypothetical protein
MEQVGEEFKNNNISRIQFSKEIAVNIINVINIKIGRGLGAYARGKGQ